MSCDMCLDPDGIPCFPAYGPAPHTCFYKIPGASMGQSVTLPRDQWPDNFDEDPDCPGMGAYSCPYCGEGKEDQRGEAWSYGMTEPKPVRGEDTKFGTLYVELNAYNTLREAWKFERGMKITAREQRDKLVHQLEEVPVGVSPDLLTRIEQAINNPAPDDDGGTTGEEALQLLEQLYNAVTSSDQA